jgi:hypothetical protein
VRNPTITEKNRLEIREEKVGFKKRRGKREGGRSKFD